MSGYLIKDTTKEERIALIRSWQEPDDCVGIFVDAFEVRGDCVWRKKI
jgi:hypothetical protein